MLYKLNSTAVHTYAMQKYHFIPDYTLPSPKIWFVVDLVQQLNEKTTNKALQPEHLSTTTPAHSQSISQSAHLSASQSFSL